ncbi:MAG: preprotein translocase subunit SecA [Terriglobales bacterium]
MGVLDKIFGTKNEREVKRMWPVVEQIGALEPQMQALSDDQLRAKTDEFRQRIRERVARIPDEPDADPDRVKELEEERRRAENEVLDEILPEAFAVVREAGRRVLNMRHFDVQLIGGMVLHSGKIAEMKTGEGKTLVATLPVYLNALPGRGVHVVTVNDYLAKRDAEWMGKLYRFLGLSVGVIVHDLDDEERRQAYAADVTYGTNNEFGFDYLRDNMKFDLADCVQRGHNFAIVDEVDSILIDEARTPLIISGASEESTDKYFRVNRIIPQLEKGEEIKNIPGEPPELTGDYVVDEKHKTITITDQGWEKVEKLLGIGNITFQNYFRMYKKLAGMTGTAETEAPEFEKIYKLEVTVIPTNRPLLRVENPDIVYRTEREKYNASADEIANLQQKGQPVLVGTTSIEKSERLSAQLKKKGIPHVVLNAKYHEREAEIVAQAGRRGAVTIATNMAGRGTDILLGGNPEFMAKQECVKKGIAQLVREAGGAVETKRDDESITYFYYGGNEYQAPTAQWNEVFQKHKAVTDAEHDEVVGVGGLFILGTERHEARRIDNQLRGRAGRQGDPGASRFYLSLEDDLMRIFAKEWVSTLLQRLGMEEGVPIESRMISRRIEAAQKAVEAQNFEARKHLLEYDDVMNKQREAVYGLRRQLLEGLDQKELILEDYVAGILSELMDKYAGKDVHPDNWDIKGLKNEIFTRFGVDITREGVKPEELNRQELGDAIFDKLKERYEAKERLIGPEQMRHHERMIMLSVLDSQWKDHLLNMDHLKEGIGLRGYGQHDPLVEYKRESFDMFEQMMLRFQEDTVRYLYLMQVIEPGEEYVRRVAPEGLEGGLEPISGVPMPSGGDGRRPRRVATSVDDMEEAFQRRKRRELEQARMAGAGDMQRVQQVVRSGAKVGRNDPCPCGSGKKYKKCCGVNA